MDTIWISDPKQLAIFLAQLVREGITFRVEAGCDHWKVTLLGF